MEMELSAVSPVTITVVVVGGRAVSPHVIEELSIKRGPEEMLQIMEVAE
jgi:hypothetical protein